MFVNRVNQAGVGLIEVMVALILLAVAVLGYVALQTKAITSSQESIVKTQAQSVMKNLAENIRTNNDARNLYPAQVNEFLGVSDAPKNCKTNNCSATELVNHDVFISKKYAEEFGLELGMAQCPGVIADSTFSRQCIFAAWGETKLRVNNNALDYSECMSSEGIYTSNATCLMMELY